VLKHICMNLSFHEYAWIFIIVCGVQLVQKNILLWSALGPLCFACCCHVRAVPCNPVNLTFSYKRTTKKGKRVNTSQDYTLHVCIAMYYTRVSNLYSVVELVVGCSISCCCPAKNHCLNSAPLHYQIISVIMKHFFWDTSFSNRYRGMIWATVNNWICGGNKVRKNIFKPLGF